MVQFQAMEGPLDKQSRKIATLRKTFGDDGWRQRWFVLEGDMLTWYRCPSDHSTPTSEDFRGQLPLEVRPSRPRWHVRAFYYRLPPSLRAQKASVSSLSEKELRAQRAAPDLSLKIVDKDGATRINLQSRRPIPPPRHTHSTTSRTASLRR